MRLEQLPAFLETGRWVAVAGLFDPLTAREAGMLANKVAGDSRKLLVIVLDMEDALLPAEARAALVAGLREVHLVATAKPERWQDAIPRGADIRIVEDAEAGRARCAEFIQLILDRQQAAATAAARND